MLSESCRRRCRRRWARCSYAVLGYSKYLQVGNLTSASRFQLNLLKLQLPMQPRQWRVSACLARLDRPQAGILACCGACTAQPGPTWQALRLQGMFHGSPARPEGPARDRRGPRPTRCTPTRPTPNGRAVSEESIVSGLI